MKKLIALGILGLSVLAAPVAFADTQHPRMEHGSSVANYHQPRSEVRHESLDEHHSVRHHHKDRHHKSHRHHKAR